MNAKPKPQDLCEFADQASVVRLDESSIKEAKSVLYQAYHNEPTFQFLFDHQKPGYDQRVRATLRELIELHFSKNQDAIGVTIDDSLVAVAFIGSPTVRLKLSEQLNWRIRMMLTAGLSATHRYIEYHEQVAKSLPKDQHHKLPLIAVLPNYQQKGIGSLLLSSVEAICSESTKTAGIGLDTGNTRYLSFYEKQGYEKVGEVVLGDLVEHVLFKPATKFK